MQALVGYIDGMEDKLSQMMEEMKEIRLEVGKLHDKGIRAKCVQLATAAEGKIQQVKAMVSTAKANLISSAGRMVQTFQEKGCAPPCVMRCRLCVSPPFSRAWNTASLMPARRWSNAPGSWMYSGRSCTRREAMKSAGRALAGKEVQQAQELEADKGRDCQAAGLFLSCGKTFSDGAGAARLAEKASGEKSSVKSELRN